MHWYKTLAWWVIFRCQYTLTSNNQLWGCLNPPCLVLFSAVDVVAKHSSVNKTTMNAGSRFAKAFVSSAGILNLPITSSPVDDFNDWALWCQPTGINYNMHGWILCRYCATGWFWWIRGLRAVTMWSSSSFTKSLRSTNLPRPNELNTLGAGWNKVGCVWAWSVQHILCMHKWNETLAKAYLVRAEKTCYHPCRTYT